MQHPYFCGNNQPILIKYILFIFLLCLSLSVSAQNTYTISGTIKDAKTGETIISAAIRLKQLSGTGASTNEYGFYSLTLPEGTYTLSVNYLGYRKQSVDITLNKNIHMDIQLEPADSGIGEVVVSSERNDRNVTGTEMSTIKLDVKEINKAPVLFGEKDILKTIQLLPGVATVGDGNAGFYVRGGGADQNLILLDEAPVYNASHLLGFFSIFNSDAIKDLTLIKGGMPAEYGGRLSSVLDVKMNDGNSKKFGVSGGIGLIASRLTIEGPIVKDKGSFIISGRRTYADLFLKLSTDSNLKKSVLYFYDLNFKANYEVTSRDHVYLSAYLGVDNFGYSNILGFNWGNTTATARWNHLFSDKLFLNSTFLYSKYDYNIVLGTGASQVNISSSIQDWSLKEDFKYYINPKNTLKFGFTSIYHTFLPGSITTGGTGSVNNLTLQHEFALENAVYVSDDIEFSSRLKMNAGVRYSMFSQLGPGDINTYNADGSIATTHHYNNNEVVKTYTAPEPRISANYILNEVSSIKASYAHTVQYLHLLSNSTTGSPTDLWVPSTINVKPEEANQYALGYFRNFFDNVVEASVEVYYKDFTNQIDYKNNADITFNPNVESQLVFGTGKAYGIEFYIKKKVGKLTGWISYTLARSDRSFPDIQSAPFPARQDRTHDLSIIAMYDLNKKWSFAATFVYYTGNAATFPSGIYTVDNRLVPYYTERNGYRMPDYHRLDLSATLQGKKTAKFESNWNFSVYNAYDHWNPYIIQFQKDPATGQNQALQISLFGIIPSVTFNFKF
jgi:hypothetical protein